MKSLFDYISQLPQTLQDLIGEFNADHREQYTLVMIELTNKHQICNICDKIIFRVVYTTHCSYINCCSFECLENYEIYQEIADETTDNYYE
jgi:hypothetical protein